MSALTYRSFYFFVLNAALVGCIFLLSLSHEFEQFWATGYVCAKNIGRSGFRAQYPQALSQPSHQ